MRLSTARLSHQPHPYTASPSHESLQAEDCLPDVSSSFFPACLIPVSPPAPHRRAPKPPTYAPRRDRPNHINMREPASCGLFTVAEREEDELNYDTDSSIGHSIGSFSLMYDLPSAVPSSEIFPSPSSSPGPEYRRSDYADVPRDVDEEMDEVEQVNRLSWSSHGSSATATMTEGETDNDEGRGLSTPNMENDDPFRWQIMPLSDGPDLDVEMAERTVCGHLYTPLSFNKQPTLAESLRISRRPPPLTLTTRHLTPVSTPTLYSANPCSAISNASTAESDTILTPRSTVTPTLASLLPALPIISSAEWSSRVTMSQCSDLASPTTPTRYSGKRHGHVASRSITKNRRKSPEDPVDLAMALEELLASCGEKVGSDSDFSGPASVTGSEHESASASASEDDFEAKSLRFPLPPRRPSMLPLKIAPRTPSPTTATYSRNAPFAPRKERRGGASRTRGSGSPASSPTALKGDHSFLTALSTGDDMMPGSPATSVRSTGSSLGSASSGKSLPGRKRLPVEWTRFGGQI